MLSSGKVPYVLRPHHKGPLSQETRALSLPGCVRTTPDCQPCSETRPPEVRLDVLAPGARGTGGLYCCGGLWPPASPDAEMSAASGLRSRPGDGTGRCTP